MSEIGGSRPRGRGAEAAPSSGTLARGVDFIALSPSTTNGMAVAFHRACGESKRIEVQPDEIQAEAMPERLRLRRELLAYWVKHPEAKDTAAGMRLWWFGEGRVLPDTLLLEELEDLVQRGWAFGRGPHPAHRVFALNSAEIESIEDFLAEGPGSPE